MWYLHPDGAEAARLATAAARLFDHEESARHAAFLHPPAQAEYALTRALVRITLGRYLDAPPEALRFTRNKHGRPELGDGHPLRFNVSHSGGLIALAVAWRREIGIDVENTRASPDDDDVAKEHFSPLEFADYLRQPTPEQRHTRFLEFWTLKEAYLKARGTGLALPLDKFSCRWTDPEQVHLMIDPTLNDAEDNWRLRLLRPAPGFVGALAARSEPGESIRLVARRQPPDSLLEPSTAVTRS